MKKGSFALLLLFLHTVAGSQTVHFTLAVIDSPAAISPYIYGTNQLMTGGENWTSMRQGGNRLTGYNWENNASNAGNDYFHQSDDYLTWVSGIPGDSANVPAIVTRRFYEQAHGLDAYPLVTLQMAGFVAKDKSGPVDSAHTAPSSRWAYVKPVKGAPLSLVPDAGDDSVYMDEYVNFLLHSFGSAGSGVGIRGYALDNEPALWPSTHPRIHPLQPTCRELIQRSVALARSVKALDPDAEIFGPVAYGFASFLNFQSAPDWGTVSAGKGYVWFLDYYLDQIKKAGDTTGSRLLDVLDLHWYPEAQGSEGNRITNTSATTASDRQARVQAPRTLWDARYREKSWISQWYATYLPLVPKVQQSIQKYYPGTKLGFTEFEYGGESDITGAIAIVDVLGIFAKYGVYLATYWQGSSQTPYISAAYKVYRNYDGNNSTFGDAYLPSRTSDSVNTSVYGSMKRGTDEIHLIAINKNLGQPVTGHFALSSGSPAISHTRILSGKVWQLNGRSTQIRDLGDLSGISDSAFTYNLDSASVYHFVLQTSTVTDVAETKAVSDEFALLQNYPNPFNPSTTIGFMLPQRSRVTLAVFNTLGQRVATLVDGEEEAGHHEVKFSPSAVGAAGLASGIYLYRLETPGFVQTRKLLLLH